MKKTSPITLSIIILLSLILFLHIQGIKNDIQMADLKKDQIENYAMEMQYKNDACILHRNCKK